MKNIKLSKCEVSIIEVLTWGQQEDIQEVIMKGLEIDKEGLQNFDYKAIRESTYKALEVCIKEIKEGDKVIPFTKEWMNGLSAEDGNILQEAINEVTSKKK